MKRSPVSEVACAPSGDLNAGEGTLAHARETLARSARETTAKLKSAAAGAAARTKVEVRHIAGERKNTAARSIGHVSSALHESARAIEDEDPNIAWFTHRAADRLQSAADHLHTRDLAGLRADAEDFTRRHPALVFGGLFALGLILGNVVKAGRRNDDADDIGETDANEATDWEPETGGYADEFHSP